MGPVVTRDLPSLEEPWPGTACPDCGEELRIVGFCAVCFEHSMQAQEVLEAERQKAIRRDHLEARRRARAWQLGKAVQQ